MPPRGRCSCLEEGRQARSKPAEVCDGLRDQGRHREALRHRSSCSRSRLQSGRHSRPRSHRSWSGRPQTRSATPICRPSIPFRVVPAPGVVKTCAIDLAGYTMALGRSPVEPTKCECATKTRSQCWRRFPLARLASASAGPDTDENPDPITTDPNVKPRRKGVRYRPCVMAGLQLKIDHHRLRAPQQEAQSARHGTAPIFSPLWHESGELHGPLAQQPHPPNQDQPQARAVGRPRPTYHPNCKGSGQHPIRGTAVNWPAASRWRTCGIRGFMVITDTE